MTRRLDPTGLSMSAHGTIHADGPAAVEVLRVMTLASSMALTLQTGLLPTRGVTKTRMRDAANAYSGSTARSLKPALRDLVLWMEVALERPCTNPRVLEAAGLPPVQEA